MRWLESPVGTARPRLSSRAELDSPTISVNEFSKHRPPGFHLMFQPQHRRRNLFRPRPRYPHHSNPSAPGRCRNGDNRIVKFHGPIVAV